jgi:hypothetical protein
MTTFWSSFSPRTTKPEGRNGRRPTIVRMTRSGATRTLDMGTGAGGATALRRAAHPASHKGADANSRRESGIPPWYRVGRETDG